MLSKPLGKNKRRHVNQLGSRVKIYSLEIASNLPVILVPDTPISAVIVLGF